MHILRVLDDESARLIMLAASENLVRDIRTGACEPNMFAAPQCLNDNIMLVLRDMPVTLRPRVLNMLQYTASLMPQHAIALAIDTKQQTTVSVMLRTTLELFETQADAIVQRWPSLSELPKARTKHAFVRAVRPEYADFCKLLNHYTRSPK